MLRVILTTSFVLLSCNGKTSDRPQPEVDPYAGYASVETCACENLRNQPGVKCPPSELQRKRLPNRPINCNKPEPDSPYPQARRGDVVDNYHGTKVADPYRWLENPDAKETKKWIEAQNKLTYPFLAAIPEREAIKARLTELWNYEKYSAPSKRKNRYFFFRNDGLQNQSVMYWSVGLSGKPKVLIDPNKFSEDGTSSLAGASVSKNGKLLAYGVRVAGSDWVEWRIRNIDTGKDYPERVKWSKFSSAEWSHDSKGFYYSRYPEPTSAALRSKNENQKLYYHKVGSSQDNDSLIYSDAKHPKYGFSATVTEDGRYLLLGIWKGTGRKNLLYFKDLRKQGSKFVAIIDAWENEYQFIGNVGARFWFITDKDAPRRKLVEINITRPAAGNWKEIIPQAKDPLRSVSAVGKRLIANYMVDAHSKVIVYSERGKKVREVSLPGIGSASGFGGLRSDRETFYGYSSFNTPGIIYRYNVATGKSTVYRKPDVKFDPSTIEVKQVFYTSKDGTRVPMFVVHKKGLALDGNNPTYLYGYGGFGASLTPFFSISLTVWMERGGVVAIPNLRGGGEYGEEWHQAGTKLRKQNVFDDFIAAAEWLIANKYTKSEKLAVAGGSNGGLLVGAVITQRPQLFGAALPAVGVLDMLRFHKFTIGWAWVDDYGSSENPEEFKALYAYSPYHNVKPGTKYPSTMITTADHDDRVVPGHSFKFAAALQHAHRGNNPVLIRVQTKAGHGAGKPTTMKIQEEADRWAFLTKVLKVGN